MWSTLAILCLITTFSFNNAERSLNSNSFSQLSDSTPSRLRNLEDVPARLSRIFGKNSRTRRLHIEDQHGFDGKVEKINVNSEEDLPGIRAYGVQKKKLMNNGYIEKSIQREIDTRSVEDGSRVTRSIEAYGKTKDRLETNGSIERGNPSTIHETRRSPRSIETETTKQDGVKEGDLEDLEGQDAKVFRPLFVYRQQMARKQHRAKNQIYGFPKIPCEKRAPIF
ncbi:uncharacterized protein LOC107963970 [Apis mellifera]|uniref:Uncharacterized protein LOC107963970 n=1 Tax=Apis mellifera TaxID=7460 RepID=A0A7M7FZD3_APIME|nr:uncharacterized protein LOC107963970 [Apis mellifera]|eukprot:XP_001121053.2 uncharacterized protein LOC107963970 [Apis mellifera]